MAEKEGSAGNQLTEAVRKTRGLIAILDALGAGNYTLDRVADYLAARRQLQDEVSRFAQDARVLMNRFDTATVNWFTFQDTVILAYESPGDEVSLEEIQWFAHVLRTFEIMAISKSLLFRGAFAVGDFHKLSSATNTVLGPAVRDAAGWYERTDWIGIHATPRTTLFIRSLLDLHKMNIDFVLVEYPVPLKPGSISGERTIDAYAVNWPKGFHLRLGTLDAQQIRGNIGRYLVADEIPTGAERKHLHALEFYDHVVVRQDLRKSFQEKKQGDIASSPTS